MKYLFRWKNARYVAALYEWAGLFRIVNKTEWVRIPNVINVWRR